MHTECTTCEKRVKNLWRSRAFIVRSTEFHLKFVHMIYISGGIFYYHLFHIKLILLFLPSSGIELEDFDCLRSRSYKLLIILHIKKAQLVYLHQQNKKRA